MKVWSVSNVSSSAPPTSLASAKLAGQNPAKNAAHLTAVLLNVITTIAAFVSRKINAQKELKNMCPIIILYLKYLDGLMTQCSPMTMKFRRDPTKPVMICHNCAKRKLLIKAPQVWTRDGRCHFCLDRVYVCQAIEYMLADPTVLH
jgi:hypothetical protein